MGYSSPEEIRRLAEQAEAEIGEAASSQELERVRVAYLGREGKLTAVLGGIGSLPGAMLGGLLIGLIEAFWSSYFTVEYKDDLNAPSWRPIPPVDQWPSTRTSYFDSRLKTHRYYRLRFDFLD